MMLIETSASGVFAEMGLSPKVDYPLDVRLTVQERILSTLREQYATSNGHAITDRTPIDMMAYTLADIQRGPLTPDLELRLRKYLADCVELTNRTFSIIVVVQPGIALVDDPTKAPINKSYIDHIAHMIMGITVNEGIHSDHYYIPSAMTDLDQRVSAVDFAINRTMAKHLAYLDKAKSYGRPIAIH